MTHRIVVLGAGYAGANAAGRLARLLHPGDTEITLVNAEPDFVERVRLHQLATGSDLPSRPLRGVFAGTQVTVRTARVTAVDADRRTVTVAAGEGSEIIAYDTLVYALGSTAADHGVPGVVEHAYEVAGRPGALRLRERLAGLAAGATVLVVGGGLTGVETVTEIAESRPDLAVGFVVRGEVGGWLSDRGRRHLRTALDRLGITVHEHTDVTRVDGTGVDTVGEGRAGAGGRIAARVTVWTTGFATHPIAAAAGLEVSGTGQIVVDETMRSVSHPQVYAVGDAGIAAGVHGRPLRMSCASGIPMAWRAADAIVARLTGREAPTAPIRYVTQCISLGRRDGIIQLVTPDDRARSAVVIGRSAARIKELVCAGAAWSVAHPLAWPAHRRVTAGVPAAALS